MRRFVRFELPTSAAQSLLWWLTALVLFLAACAAIVTNEQPFSALFAVLAVIVVLLIQFFPSPTEAERARQHRELLDVLIAIREQTANGSSRDMASSLMPSTTPLRWRSICFALIICMAAVILNRRRRTMPEEGRCEG